MCGEAAKRQVAPSFAIVLNFGDVGAMACVHESRGALQLAILTPLACWYLGD